MPEGSEKNSDPMQDAMSLIAKLGNDTTRAAMQRITDDVSMVLNKVSGRELTAAEQEIKKIIGRERDLLGMI